MTVPAGGSDLPPLSCVLHFGPASLTNDCVASLLAQDVALDVLVVVNDGTGYRYEHQRVTCLDLPSNLGFSGGMNAGLGVAISEGRELALLVTNDVVLAHDAVSRMARLLLSDSSLAVCGPAIYRTSAGGEALLYSTGGLLDLDRVAATQWRSLQGQPAELDWVAGAVWLIRTDAVRDVGNFDERYFLYWEEVEWCLRARRRGWGLGVAVDAQAFEASSATASAVPGLQAYYLSRNRLLFAATYAGRRRTARLLAISLWEGLRHLICHGEPHVLRSVRDFAFGRFGGNRRYG